MAFLFMINDTLTMRSHIDRGHTVLLDSRKKEGPKHSFWLL
jgi:hypothetical protein